METVSSADDTLPASDAGGAPLPADLPVVDRAHYEILSEHARGGLGRILRARDRRTGRHVAIKEMLRGSADAGARFQREALVTANLQHPAIVPVYEVGRWPAGEPFYAMKLVDGQALDAVIRDAGTLRDRLALLPRLLDVADAIAYAHGQGVIHRDLKPANVLVGRFGETVVIDWGLARRAGDADRGPDAPAAHAASADVTLAGEVLGTPVYMPPEQARGADVDARADVYALGAMLYHLLSGRLPYGDARSADEALAAVRAGPPRPLAELEPGVPSDLLAIVTRAMAPSRDDRYPSADALAADLRRFLTGQLVGAHAYSAAQLIRRWLHRHRVPVGVAGALTAALAVVAVVAVVGIAAERDVARRERADADHQRALVEARNNHLIVTQARADVDLDPTRALAWLKQLPAGVPEWRAAAKIAADAREQGVARWVLRGHAGAIHAVVFGAGGRTVISGGDDGTVRIWDLATGTAQVFDEGGPVDQLAITPDGARLIVLGPWDADFEQGRTVRIRDLATGTERALPAQGRPATVAISSDSQSLAVLSCEGGVSLVDLATLARRSLRGDVPRPRGHDMCAQELALSPDGRTLAASTSRYSIDLLALADGRIVRAIEPGDGSVRQLGFTPDGARLLVLDQAALWSWGVAQGDRREVTPNDGGLIAFRVTADGRLALVGAGGVIQALDPSDSEPRVIARHESDIEDVILAADGRRVVSAGDDAVVRIADLDGNVTRVLRGHAGWVTTLAASVDDAWVASGSTDGTVRVWSLDGARRYARTDVPLLDALAVAPDGAAVVSGRAGCIERWSATGARTTLRACDLIERPRPLPMSASADGSVIAVARPGGGVDVWTGAVVAPRALAGPPTVSGLSLSGDGALLAVVEDDGAVPLRRLATDEPRALAAPHLVDDWWRAVAIARDGSRVVWAEADGALGVHDVTRGTTRTLPGPRGEIHELVITADGATAVSASATGPVVRWDLASGVATALLDHGEKLTLSADGAQLASAGAGDVVQVTDLATGQTRALGAHEDRVRALAFSPDGRRLASASRDTTVRRWDLATGTSRVLRHHDDVWEVAFTPDGTRVVTATRDSTASGTVSGTVAEILDDVPEDEAGLRAFLDATTDLVVDPAAP